MELPAGLVIDDGSDRDLALHSSSPTVPPADKADWRRRATAVRSSIVVDHGRYCHYLAEFLDATVEPGRRVVLYLAMGGEVDLAPLVAGSEDPGALFAVTRTPSEGFDLTVHPWGCEMEKHPYGFAQPVADAPRVAPDRIGAVLVPGLAFDLHGTRLGRGKGYYDRFLARLPNASRIGITGDYLVDRLPADRHDLDMTHLAFSTGVLATPINAGRQPDRPAPPQRDHRGRTPRSS